jgi:hypothetical protein
MRLTGPLRMKQLDRKWAFNAAMVADAPDTAGSYALWDGDQLLHVGHAVGGRDTLRARLARHLETGAPGGRIPTHYSWVIVAAIPALAAALR